MIGKSPILSVSLFLFCLVFAIPGESRANLVFDFVRIDLHADAKAEEIQGTFSFKNRGFETAKIVEVESTCGCLSASMTKAEYEPGEKGMLRAIFKLTNFIGTHKKLLIITTNDPKQRPIELEVVIHVPEVFRITPDMHEWIVGGPTDEKVYSLEILGDTPINVSEIGATRDNVKYDLEVLEKGRRYQIKLKPDTTEKVMIGAVKVTTDSEVPKFQRKLLYFAISKESKKLTGE